MACSNAIRVASTLVMRSCVFSNGGEVTNGGGVTRTLEETGE
ncbi:21570_t:CDS:1, partial [Dentiscutata erythropus]